MFNTDYAAVFPDCSPALVKALADALIERRVSGASAAEQEAPIAPPVSYRLRRAVPLRELALFESADAAAQGLWAVLQAQGVIKAPKITWPTTADLTQRKDAIKALLRSCDLQADKLDDAVNSVLAVIEPTIGMLRSLDDKKITVKFAEIAQAYFMDHGQAVPPALREFVEAGLDVVASLIEKKDPPTGYETTGMVVMGVAQIVAGVLIKEFVPCVGEVLRHASQEGGFASVLRAGQPAINAAASMFAQSGGLGTLLSSAGELATLGVSVARIATLVDTEVTVLERTVRLTKERKTAGSAQPINEAALTTLLDSKQREFTDGLVNIVNSLLSTSVYSPLVSRTTKLAADKVVGALLEQSETEKVAASPDAILRAMEQKADPNKAFFDENLRSIRGADTEIQIDALPPEERAALREKLVQSTGKTLAQLQSEYEGCDLRFYVDAEHRLYVQRPDRAEYSEGIRLGKPAGEPEFVAAAQLYEQSISLTDRDTGAVKTYYPDGHIDSLTPDSAILLDYTPGQNGQLAHITVAGAPPAAGPGSAANKDCFYTAIIEAPKRDNAPDSTVVSVREKVAGHLAHDDGARLFYHNWSLDGRVKEFAGWKSPLSPVADAYDDFADKAWDMSPRIFALNPSLSTVAGLVGIQYGRGIADALRFGEGIAEQTPLGYAQDGLRLLVFAPPVIKGGFVAARVGKNVHTELNAVFRGIPTPHGVAKQVWSFEAFKLRLAVHKGALLHRFGAMGKSHAAEAQFWSFKNPLTQDLQSYAKGYGIPASNMSHAAPMFTEGAHLQRGAPFIIREAAAVGNNPGGEWEVVTRAGGAVLKFFHTH